MPKPSEPTILHAGVRDGGEEWHIECRMSDGQKYAVILVDKPFEQLAHQIADFLNEKAAIAPSPPPLPKPVEPA